MHRETSDRVFLGQTVSPFEDAVNSSAIDRAASNYRDAKEKAQKTKELNTGELDGDIAKYIPGALEIKVQGMLKDADTREKEAHSSGV